MDFKDDANLDSSQVQDRGSSGGGIGGGPGVAIGGGITGIIALIAALIFGINPGNLTGGDPAPVESGSNLSETCKTGQDADQSEKCRVVGVVNSVQSYWSRQISDYRPATTNLFSGNVQTGCGAADSSVGPFYCPADEQVYLDLKFFDELQSRFGAKGGPFAQAYVIGHEYGHHVQHLLGTTSQVNNNDTGPDSDAVKLELQADCYAGAWAINAFDTGLFEKRFTDQDIQEALSAAAAVGDDSIQERTQGRVNPEAFTHGTSEQRVKWFKTGYASGDFRDCNTF